MSGFLLDTNAVSALRKPAENRSLSEFIAVQPMALLHTSTMTIAEIRYGIEITPNPARRADLGDWLERTLLRLFRGRVHEADEAVLLRWLLINHDGQERGHTFALQDALIAAVAAVHKLIVVTGDETHFVAAGVSTLNPWTSRFWSNDRQERKVKSLASATLATDLIA